jgi:hypothetical protein
MEDQMTDGSEFSAPAMRRSINQLATVYAPGSFFTFEAGLGACLSRPIPGSPEEVAPSTRDQIYSRMSEYIKGWFKRAVSCRDGSGHPPVEPELCVERALLCADQKSVVSAIPRDRFELLKPSQMGYVPAPLTLVCSRCGKVRTYDKVAKLNADLETLRDKSPCVGAGGKERCDWRQLDVVFVHWSGEWAPALPGLYQYNQATANTFFKPLSCKCGSKEFKLDTSSPQIGNWAYVCMKCNNKADDRWIQNDPFTLQVIGRTLSQPEGHRIAEARMESVSYRASSVYYVQSDQFIDFREDSYRKLLESARKDELCSFIGKTYGFAVNELDQREMEAVVKAAGKGEEWGTYRTLKEIANRLRANPKEAKALDDRVADMKKGWQEAGILPTTVSLPPSIVEDIDMREELVSRFDPYRLAVEHHCLKKKKIECGETSGGKRAFVNFVSLDPDLAPVDQDKKAIVEQETEAYLKRLGIEQMGLIREFDLCKFSFGYTRMSAAPVLYDKHNMNMPVRLRLFEKTRVSESLRHPVYVIQQANQAFYIRLDEKAVFKWIESLGCVDFSKALNSSIGGWLLERHVPFDLFLESVAKPSPPKAYVYTYILLHTYAHHLMRGISEWSGLDLGSLGEYLFPADLAFVVYRNGTTMDLGNLSAMWRNSSVVFLRYLLNPRSLKCGSGSLCVKRGGSCPDCLMVPETSCLAQNKLLSRSVLVGGGCPREDQRETSISGYFEAVRQA